MKITKLAEIIQFLKIAEKRFLNVFNGKKSAYFEFGAVQRIANLIKSCRI